MQTAIASAKYIKHYHIPSEEQPSYLGPRLMKASYDSADIPYVLRCLVERKLLLPSYHRLGEDLLFVYDLDALDAGFKSLVNAFPPHFVHCYAVKAAPMSFIVQAANKAGLGIEAASILEVENGVRNGCPMDRIVFDSPAKTYRELDFALENGIHINANCLEEVDRIANIIAARGIGRVTGGEAVGGGGLSSPTSTAAFPPGTIGLRINPLVGAGKIEELSVSTLSSKFGVNLIEGENKTSILAKFQLYPWLCGLHIHVGSQGLQMEQMAKGIKVMVELANEIDRLSGYQRIKVLDIGGGLTANYDSDAFLPSYVQLIEVIQKEVPEVFLNSSRKVFTEFGRSLTAKAAWAVSRVEYAFDNHPTLRTAVIHAGADCLLRECYTTKFPHRFTGFDKDGVPLIDLIPGRVGGRPIQAHNIVGPLCFAGDVVAKSCFLPRLDSNDLVVIHDTGANSLALFSRHCSRPAPMIVGYRCKKGEFVSYCVEVMQEGEKPDEVMAFWGLKSGKEGDGKEGGE